MEQAMDTAIIQVESELKEAERVAVPGRGGLWVWLALATVSVMVATRLAMLAEMAAEMAVMAQRGVR